MTDGVKYNWASIPDFNTLPTPKKEDKRSKKDSAQEQAAQEIRTRFHDGLASLYDIFNVGAPYNEKPLLKQGKFKQISESKKISDIAKMAAEAFKDGMVLGNYFVRNHTALGCNFMSDFGGFCATCGRIVALAEQEGESIRNEELNKDLRVEYAVEQKLKKTQELRDEYIRLCDEMEAQNPEVTTTEINRKYREWLENNNIVWRFKKTHKGIIKEEAKQESITRTTTRWRKKHFGR